MLATRFAVAVHIMLLVAARSHDEKATSELIARSVGTNPVVVRRITGRLARAGLMRVRRGPGGAVLTRSAEEITLGDVWRAMKDPDDRPLLPLHGRAQHCPIGQPIHGAFARAENAWEQALSHTTLGSLAAAAPLNELAAAD
jgi:DNA-binding IscR family transcriptional regulator